MRRIALLVSLFAVAAFADEPLESPEEIAKWFADRKPEFEQALHDIDRLSKLVENQREIDEKLTEVEQRVEKLEQEKQEE